VGAFKDVREPVPAAISLEGGSYNAIAVARSEIEETLPRQVREHIEYTRMARATVENPADPAANAVVSGEVRRLYTYGRTSRLVTRGVMQFLTSFSGLLGVVPIAVTAGVGYGLKVPTHIAADITVIITWRDGRRPVWTRRYVINRAGESYRKDVLALQGQGLREVMNQILPDVAQELASPPASPQAVAQVER
jgi:hypothetical protein